MFNADTGVHSTYWTPEGLLDCPPEGAERPNHVQSQHHPGQGVGYSFRTLCEVGYCTSGKCHCQGTHKRAGY